MICLPLPSHLLLESNDTESGRYCENDRPVKTAHLHTLLERLELLLAHALRDVEI